MKSKFILILAVVLLVGPVTVQAVPMVFTAFLDGPSEAPPNASPGTGFATVTIDDVLKTMRVESSFSGLIGTTTAAHIHCCTAVPGVSTAGVATTTPSFPGFPLGVTSGSQDEVFDMTLASSYNPSFVTANGGTTDSAFTALLSGMNAGSSYFNIHTTSFGGGEIRGFLQIEVPTPGTLLLLGLGLAGLSFRGWRRKA